jgi:uncharacterized protein
VPKRIFIDSLFVIALVNRRDLYHRQAVSLAASLRGQPVLLTDAILLEVGNGLARRYKKEAAAIIEQFLTAQEAKVVHLTPDLFREAFELYKTYLDKSWGMVDCISFIVMRQHGVEAALTFDGHFTQAGFQALMR